MVTRFFTAIALKGLRQRGARAVIGRQAAGQPGARRVRERLVNLDDPLFGLHPLSFKTFNRFRADLEADDLDATGVSAEVGIGRHHPVHVGPDLDAFGVEPGTYNGC